MTHSYRNVCDHIIPNGYCSGCGVCGGICPTSALRMDWNTSGEYVPFEEQDKCTSCQLCLKVCPFQNQPQNETTLAAELFGWQEGVRNDSVTGFYLGLFSGYANQPEHRARGAGGGLTTWLLEDLLARGNVDRVVCAMRQPSGSGLPVFGIVDHAAAIRASAKSVYYPLELSGVLREILRDERAYAIVALPCVVKSLRLAMLSNDKLRLRLKVIIGLVCGQQKSRSYAEYLCAAAGGDPRTLAGFSFRNKDHTRHHLDHRFEFECKDGRKGHVYQSGGAGWLWGHDCFKLSACNYCDDITAELADVTFGDAIAEPFCFGNGGANFVIVRSKDILNILVEGKVSGQIILEPAPLEAIRARQAGTLLLKRDDLSYRLFLKHRQNDGRYIPIKRVHPARRFNPLKNSDMLLRERLQSVTLNTFAKHRDKADVVFQVESAMRSVLEEEARRDWHSLILMGAFRLLENIRCWAASIAGRLFAARSSS